MSEPAYDQRFDRDRIKVRSVELDAIRSWEAVRWAAERQLEQGFKRSEIDEGSCAWVCFVDGAHTERSLSGPKPRGFASAWPEIWRPEVEIFEARLARLVDDLPEYEVDCRPAPPTAAALARWYESSKWLHFVHGDKRSRDQKIIWYRAQGVGYPILARTFGLSSKVIANIKSVQKERIGLRLKQKLRAWGLALEDIL